jgi:hypothetical protein
MVHIEDKMNRTKGMHMDYQLGAEGVCGRDKAKRWTRLLVLPRDRRNYTRRWSDLSELHRMFRYLAGKNTVVASCDNVPLTVAVAHIPSCRLRKRDYD